MRILIAFLITSLLFSSCYKFSTSDAPPTTNNTTTPVTPDSVYLSKITIVEKDNNGIVQDSTIREFVFDNLKRVERMTYFDPSINYFATQYFYYFSNSVNADKDSINDGSVSVVHFYKYSGNKLVTDSFVSKYLPSNSVLVRLRNYTYSSNKIYFYQKSTNISGTYYDFDYRDTATVDAAGNVIANKQWYVLQPDSIDYYGTYTYDNKNSAYKMLNIKQNLGIIPSSVGEFISHTNNFSSVQQNDAFSAIINTTWSSTYNSKNYPTTTTELDLSANSKRIYTYIYRAL